MELARRVRYTSLRNLTDDDIEELKRIHERHYKSEFSISEFFDHCIGAWCVGDNEGLITIGSIHPILEFSAITDKDRDPITRRNALIKLNDFAKHVAKTNKFRQLHAFIQEPSWYKQIQNYGYRPTKGSSVVTDV